MFCLQLNHAFAEKTSEFENRCASMGKGQHEPANCNGNNNENDKVSDGGDDAFFDSGVEDASKDRRDQNGAEKQSREMAEG